MDMLYRNMERLYRNQHFYYERNRAHKEVLDGLQMKVKLIKGWKIIILLVCGALQYFVIKKVIDRKEQGDNSSKNRKNRGYQQVSSI